MKPIQITVNGEPLSLPGGSTLQQALALIRPSIDESVAIATALNGRHVLRADRTRAMLSDGDQVTTFEPITGG